jgi:hypothetical protein
MTIGGATQKSGTGRVAVSALIGLAVAAVLFIFGRVHTPNYYLGLFGRSYADVTPLKVLLASIMLGLAVLQVGLALWLYQKLPMAGRAPKPVGMVHRVVGTLLFVVSLPIAIHCLLAYGVQFGSLRVAIHSIAGVFFYGAFVAKVLLVQSKKLPGWALPVAGGMLAVLTVVLWYTSALWYYNNFTLPG